MIEIDDSGDGTPERFANALYDPTPTSLQEILNLGAGGWWWPVELGVGQFNQFELNILASLVRGKDWLSVWTIVAASVTPASIEHIEAVAIRDHSIFLGGVASHAEALDEASLRVSQAEFDNGLRIFYGLAVGNTDQIPNQNTRGIFELKLYTQATITRTRQGIWVGPDATEQRVAELIEVHRAEATAHQQPGGGGGGGETRTVIHEAVMNVTANLAKLPGDIVCPEVGMIEYYFESQSGDRQGAIATGRIPAARLYAAQDAIGQGLAQSDSGQRKFSLGANRRVGMSAEATNHFLTVGAQSVGNYLIIITHIT